LALITSRIPWRFRLGLFTALAVAWCSGVCFFVLSRWFAIEGEFGPEKHPWQQPALMIHGAAAFFMMVGYGALLFAHAPLAWRLRRLRVLGLCLVSAIGLQMLTGYLLYYLANEELRGLVGNTHAAIGFSLPFLLASHVIIGNRTRVSRLPGI